MKGPSKDEVQNRVPLKYFEAAAGDLASTTGVRRPRAAMPRRRRKLKTKNKEGRRTGWTDKDATNVLCRLMSAQARYHQPMGVVPATDGRDLKHHADSTQREWALQPD